jgi:hypothetical protein
MEVSRGSEIGVRKAVARLVNQGIVFATQMGRNVVHELNRDHLAAPAADVLAGIRTELWRRLREALMDWDVKPVTPASSAPPPDETAGQRATSI